MIIMQKGLFLEEMNLFLFSFLYFTYRSGMLARRITWITSQGFWSNNGTFVIVARDVIAKLPPDFVGVTCIWNLEAGPNNPLGRWGPMISMRFVVIVSRIVVIKGTRVQFRYGMTASNLHLCLKLLQMKNVLCLHCRSK